MSDKIKPSEVSQVLLDQLKGISDAEKFDEVGTVLTVSDGVARIYGLRNAEANELLEFENGTMAIVMNLEEALYQRLGDGLTIGEALNKPYTPMKRPTASGNRKHLTGWFRRFRR